MKIRLNPEYKGMFFLLLIISGVGLVLAVATGTLELWTGPQAFDRIVFVSEKTGKPEIWLMNTDGSHPVALTSGAGVRSAPAISPQANRILYVGKFGKSEQIFAIGVRGGRPERLTSATGPKRVPAFTPDGKNISFIASGRVYAADKNGENLSPILPTRQEIHAAMTDPLRRGEIPIYLNYAWGPDSEKLVGIRQELDGNHSVVFLPKRGDKPRFIPVNLFLNQLIAREGISKRRLAPDQQVHVTGLSWARDAALFAITLTSGRDGFLTVFAVEKGEPRLAGFKSFFGINIAEPTFAPDGSAIVMTVNASSQPGKQGLVRLDLQTGEVQVLASGIFEGPQYSPNGDKILATKWNSAHSASNLIILDLTTGETKQLTHDGSSYYGVWSPTAAQKDSR